MVKDCAPVCGPIYVIWNFKPTTRDYPQELVGKMVTIQFKDVILVRKVALTKSWNQHVVDFKGSELAYGFLNPRLLVWLVLHGDGVLENKRSVFSRRVYIDARLAPFLISSEGKFIFTDLKSAVQGTKADRVADQIAPVQIFKAIDIDVEGLLSFVLSLSKLF